jgi:hypothetical protein
MYSLILLPNSQHLMIKADNGSSDPRLSSWIKDNLYTFTSNKTNLKQQQERHKCAFINSVNPKK